MRLSVAQSVSSADLADETRFQDPMLGSAAWPRPRRFRCCTATLTSGSLLLAHAEPRPFATDELQYFETIAHLVSTTIAHDKVREELQARSADFRRWCSIRQYR